MWNSSIVASYVQTAVRQKIIQLKTLTKGIKKRKTRLFVYAIAVSQLTYLHVYTWYILYPSHHQ